MGSKRNKILGKVVGAISDLEKASSTKRIIDVIRENPQNEQFTDKDFKLAIIRGVYKGVIKKLKSGTYRLGKLGERNHYDREHDTDSRRRRRGSRGRGRSRRRSRKTNRSRSRSDRSRSSSSRRRRSSGRRRRRGRR